MSDKIILKEEGTITVGSILPDCSEEIFSEESLNELRDTFEVAPIGI